MGGTGTETHALVFAVSTHYQCPTRRYLGLMMLWVCFLIKIDYLFPDAYHIKNNAYPAECFPSIVFGRRWFGCTKFYSFTSPTLQRQFSENNSARRKKQLLLKWASEVASKIQRMSEVPHQLPSSDQSESFIEFAAELLTTDDSDRQINMYRLM